MKKAKGVGVRGAQVPNPRQSRAGAPDEAFLGLFLCSPLFCPEVEAWGWDLRC